MNEIKRAGYFYDVGNTYVEPLEAAQAILAARKLSDLCLGFDYFAPCTRWREMLRALREVEAYDGLAGECEPQQAIGVDANNVAL